MDKLIDELVAAETGQNIQHLKNAVSSKIAYQNALLGTDFDHLFQTLNFDLYPQSCTVIIYHMSLLIQQKIVQQELSNDNSNDDDDNNNDNNNNSDGGSTTQGSNSNSTTTTTTTTTKSTEQASPITFSQFLRYSSGLFLQGNMKMVNDVLALELSEICRCVATVACRRDQMNDTSVVLNGLQQVIIQLSNMFSGCLFPAHVSLLKISLATRNFDLALPLLNTSIYTVEPRRTGLRTKEMLLYFYYGGMVYTSIKLYKKATEFFLNCVTCPSKVLSAIAIEAYKKYYLTSLLAYGKSPPELPKLTSSVVKRNAPSLVSSYKRFADAYKANNLVSMNNIAQENLEEFQNDQNMELICHCLFAYKRHQIKKLTNTFITLSLKDIADKVKLPSASDAEIAIQDMIDRKEIFAEIDRSSQMVRFSDDPQQYDDENALVLLSKRVAETEKLARCIEEVNENVSLSREFLITVPKSEEIVVVDPNFSSATTAYMMMDTENEQKA